MWTENTGVNLNVDRFLEKIFSSLYFSLADYLIPNFRPQTLSVTSGWQHPGAPRLQWFKEDMGPAANK